jgi:hypothetical protein
MAITSRSRPAPRWGQGIQGAGGHPQPEILVGECHMIGHHLWAPSVSNGMSDVLVARCVEQDGCQAVDQSKVSPTGTIGRPAEFQTGQVGDALKILPGSPFTRG